MKTTQKIKRIIILLSVMLALSLTCLFSTYIDNFSHQFLLDRFSLVSSKENLLVHFVSVGQGDAIVINLPNGKVVMIDTGPTDSASTLSNYISDRVVGNSLHKNIDYLILTHPDADHIGGAVKILKKFNVKKIYLPTRTADSNTYIEMMEYIEKNNYDTDIITTTTKIEDNYLEILAPLSTSEDNDSCPIIRLEFMSNSFLFTGDITSGVEEILVDNYSRFVDVDVLKVSHHGSKYSTTDEFLSAVTPKYAIISSGNEYGHPHDETLERLESHNATIYRTDNKGNILFVVGEDYGLDYTFGDYFVSRLSLDYSYLIFIIDGFLIVSVVITATKKIKIKKKFTHKKEK